MKHILRTLNFICFPHYFCFILEKVFDTAVETSAPNTLLQNDSVGQNDMISTSDKLSKWLMHVTGEKELQREPSKRRLIEAVDLNRNAQEIISTFGQKEFTAMVGFIDMCGFSTSARGKSPAEVRDIASPFVSSIVEIATKHHCFIDKTIGDEVMIVMPSFNWDVALSEVGLKVRDPLLLELGKLIVDAIDLLAVRVPRTKFTAGFAMGRAILDRVGGKEYGEWTVYGNVVNAAKRLQTLRDQEDTHWLAVGAIQQDEPHWREELEAWMKLVPEADRLNLLNSSIKSADCKGVGQVCYASAGVAVKDA